MREELRVGSQRAVLVGVLLPDDPHRDDADPLEELKGLVKTSGVEVVGELLQKRMMPDPTTFLGRGKIEGDLKALIAATDAELVIFDNNLSPAQGRNLEQALKKIIVDRSEVILDIFASHARTYESRLQVELAQLLYTRPRLKRMWTHLSREGGGSGGANKGTGEQQIEIDRRLIDVRVAELQRKLGAVERQRQRMVSQRRDKVTVSLVGYTNAGKSTLMNALTGADVYAADQLFATLDTRTRNWRIPHWGEVLLSDTVGFVRDLPHHLVASFRSTLEEARNAGVLLHVVDASHPHALEQIQTVEDVLTEIEVPHEDALLVLNKVDAVEDRSLLDVLRARFPNAINISARTGLGLDQLTQVVTERLSGGFVEAEVETHVGNGKLIGYLKQHSEILDTQYSESNSNVTFHCRIPQRYFRTVQSWSDTQVNVVNGPSPGAQPVSEECLATDAWQTGDGPPEVSDIAITPPAAS